MQQNDWACCTSRRGTQPGPIDKWSVIQDLHLMMVTRLFCDRPSFPVEKWQSRPNTRVASRRDSWGVSVL
jgi:hypothetical protein